MQLSKGHRSNGSIVRGQSRAEIGEGHSSSSSQNAHRSAPDVQVSKVRKGITKSNKMQHAPGATPASSAQLMFLKPHSGETEKAKLQELAPDTFGISSLHQDNDQRESVSSKAFHLDSDRDEDVGTGQPSLPWRPGYNKGAPLREQRDSDRHARNRRVADEPHLPMRGSARRPTILDEDDPSCGTSASAPSCTSLPGMHRVPGIFSGDDEEEDDTIQVGGSSMVNSVEIEEPVLEAVLVNEQELANRTREELLRDAEIAVVVRKRRPVCLAATACLAISAAIALGVAFGMSSSSTPEDTPLLVSQEPTTTATPSQAPSESPSMAPTGFNDICEFARGPLRIASWGMQFELNDIVLGNTTGAHNDSSIPNCNDVSQSDSPGLWYYVIGNGKSLYATTCTNIFHIDGDYDSQMSIMTGSCDNLTCVGGNDDDETDLCGSEAGVVWESLADVKYYVYIHAYFDSETGSFGLGVREFLNDRCQIATGPIHIDKVYAGSTANATGDVVNACFGASQSQAPGVWYSILGTGQEFVAETCVGIAELEGHFFKQITILTGDCEDGDSNLECITGASYGSCMTTPGETAVVWQSTPGTLYYIFVHGYRGQTGVFGLRVREAQE